MNEIREDIKMQLAIIYDEIGNCVEEINKGEVDLLKLVNDMALDLDGGAAAMYTISYKIRQLNEKTTVTK